MKFAGYHKGKRIEGHGKNSYCSATQHKSQQPSTSIRQMDSYCQQLASLALDLIHQGGQEIHFDIKIYNIEITNYVDGNVLNEVLSREWLSVTAINI